MPYDMLASRSPLPGGEGLGEGERAAGAVPEGFDDAGLAELFITGRVTRGDGDGVSVRKSGDHKCGRCWRLLPEVPEDGGLCHRCEDAVAQLDAVP